MSHSQRFRHVSVVSAVLAALMTAGCGSDEPAAEPAAVCSSVDALETSVQTVTEVDVSQGALAQLRDNLVQVQSDLGTVRDDAADEYATEIDAVDEAAAAIGTSAQAALSSPSSQALTDIGAAIEELGSSLSSLEEAVSSTC